MACGTTVVATHFDGLADIIGAPEAGRIVTRATPTGLVDAIRELLAAPPQREATRLYAEGFDWQVTTAGQIELFHDICNHGEDRRVWHRVRPANRKTAGGRRIRAATLSATPSLTGREPRPE